MSNTKKENITRCPQCGSSHTVKDGICNHTKKQRYQCKSCGKNFSDIGRDRIRILVMSDLHCGHKYGLTPPTWHINEDDDKQCFDFQKESWMWYENMINLWKPFNICIVNGDAVDGKGSKNGGNECLTSDRNKQAKIAFEAIKKVNAKRYFIVRGTPYHSGNEENFEEQIAINLKGTFVNKLFLDVNGCKIKTRHKIGSSSVPHGRATPLLKSLIWDALNVDNKQDRANILIYSHVHYHIMAGYSNNRMVFTTPSLQGRTEFGETQCDGIVHFGVVILDIEKDGMFTQRLIKANLESLKQKPIF